MLRVASFLFIVISCSANAALVSRYQRAYTSFKSVCSNLLSSPEPMRVVAEPFEDEDRPEVLNAGVLEELPALDLRKQSMIPNEYLFRRFSALVVDSKELVSTRIAGDLKDDLISLWNGPLDSAAKGHREFHLPVEQIPLRVVTVRAYVPPRLFNSKIAGVSLGDTFYSLYLGSWLTTPTSLIPSALKLVYENWPKLTPWEVSKAEPLPGGCTSEGRFTAIRIGKWNRDGYPHVQLDSDRSTYTPEGVWNYRNGWLLLRFFERPAPPLRR